ncbi:MAG: class I SAM-dependent methyltransferase [Burkholderiales bacterium]|nr:class I SAM-dependent methyltransferase [Burkholderiales bacterium]
MSGFSEQWLALREGADAAARAAALVPAIRPRDGRTAVVVDLGAGTGANLRWLAPRLACPSRWIAVDHDAALLARITARPFPEGTAVEPLALDLAQALDRVPFAQADLVTASALLDLVSEAWLERLAAACAAARVPVLFALTYDGRVAWTPRERGDETVRELVNRHQRGDKGFGPALGPAAAGRAAALFAARGYEVSSAASDWTLGPEEAALQSALVAGWLEAALEVAPAERAALADWAARRRAWIASGASRLAVGHVDLGGLPERRNAEDAEGRRENRSTSLRGDGSARALPAGAPCGAPAARLAVQRLTRPTRKPELCGAPRPLRPPR